jgi:ABC-type multidrug transport system fused ATPase/permease subunit
MKLSRRARGIFALGLLLVFLFLLWPLVAVVMLVLLALVATIRRILQSRHHSCPTTPSEEPPGGTHPS